MVKKIFGLIIASLVLVGCSDDNEQKDPNDRGIIYMNEEEAQIAKSSNNFTFKLLNAVNGSLADNSQVTISPFGASMAMNGASGETLEEIQTTLGFSGTTLESINAFNSRLLTEITELDKTTVLNLSNSLWLNGTSPTEQYKSTITEYYGADVFTRDFSDASTLNEINNWCSKRTNGKIVNMFAELLPTEKLKLINAIYFKAPWQKPFTSVTTDKFTTQNGEEQTAEFMNGKQIAVYREGENFKSYNIKYGNGAFEYFIVVPNSGVSVDKCAADLADGEWETVTTKEYDPMECMVELDLTMPMFETSFKADIAPALSAMGIKSAFTNNAKFPYIIDNDNVFINQIQQAVTFKIDDLGAEASAVTSNGMFSSPGIWNKMSVVIDRPFIFFVMERSSGTVLFAGKVGKI